MKKALTYTAVGFGSVMLTYLSLYYVVLWPIITARGVMDGQAWPF